MIRESRMTELRPRGRALDWFGRHAPRPVLHVALAGSVVFLAATEPMYRVLQKVLPSEEAR